MHEALESPERATWELVGKILQVGDKLAVIRRVLPRTEEDNRPWLKSKPLFGENPVDVYVSSFRGRHLLFLRTEQINTCVRIEEIEIGGQVISGPGRVCKSLGITSEKTGDVIFDGTLISIKWH